MTRLHANSSSLPTDARCSLSFFRYFFQTESYRAHVWGPSLSSHLCFPANMHFKRIVSPKCHSLPSPHSFPCLYQTSKVWNVVDSLRTSQTLLSIAIISTLFTIIILHSHPNSQTQFPTPLLLLSLNGFLRYLLNKFPTKSTLPFTEIHS